MTLAPGDIFAEINRTLVAESVFVEDRFSSIFIGILSADRRRLTYASAGHEPILLFPSQGTYRELRASGPLCGVVRTALYTSHDVAVGADAAIVCCTDGFTELRSRDNALFLTADGFVRYYRAVHSAP